MKIIGENKNVQKMKIVGEKSETESTKILDEISKLKNEMKKRDWKKWTVDDFWKSV